MIIEFMCLILESNDAICCSECHNWKEWLCCDFSADQTPTPTRFIRNCEEVGLFQDLQNVNPFEESFRKADEASKAGVGLSHEVKLLLPRLNKVIPLSNDIKLCFTHSYGGYSESNLCLF
jgi:hypothetical protein